MLDAHPTDAEFEAPHGKEEELEPQEEHGVVIRLSSEFARKGASPFSCIATPLFAWIVHLQDLKKVEQSLGRVS